MQQRGPDSWKRKPTIKTTAQYLASKQKMPSPSSVENRPKLDKRWARAPSARSTTKQQQNKCNACFFPRHPPQGQLSPSTAQISPENEKQNTLLDKTSVTYLTAQFPAPTGRTHHRQRGKIRTPCRNQQLGISLQCCTSRRELHAS